MATLIQSKQIAGIVTASAVVGTFEVSGSQVITGSQELTGDVTASNLRVSGKYYGDGSQLTFGGTGLVSGSSQVVISQTDGYTAFSQSIATDFSNIVATDISLLNTYSSSNDTRLIAFDSFTASIDSRVDQIEAVTSSFLNINGDDVVSGSVLRPNGDGVISGSVLRPDGDGVLSGSQQVIDALPTNTVSGSSQVVDFLPTGTISGSSQITITESQISDLTHYGDSDVKTKLDAEGVVSGSIQITGGSNLVSSSLFSNVDLKDFVLYNSSSTEAFLTLDYENPQHGNSVALGSKQSVYIFLDSNNSEGSNQFGIYNNITTTDNPTDDDAIFLVKEDGAVTATSFTGEILASNGIVSGSDQVLGGTGIISGSDQVLGGSGVISGSVLRPDGDDVVSGSVLRTLDGTGVISGSDQVLGGTGIISGSVLRPEGDGVVSGSDQILGGSGVLSGSVLRPDGDGIVSGSDQILGGSGVISGSVLRPNGDDVVSGSVLRPDGDGVVSGSIQITGGSNLVSSSLFSNLDVKDFIIFNSSSTESFLQLDYENPQHGNSVALGSKQSVYIFLDSNNSEGSNQFGIYNNITTTDNPTDDDAIFLVKEDGSVTATSFIGDGSGLTGVTSYTDSDTTDHLNSLGVISGSSQVNYNNLQNIPAFIGGTNVTVTSGSGGITINSTGGGGGGNTDISYLNQFTASTDIRLDGLDSATSSFDSRLDEIETTTSSIESRLDQIESNTGSYGSGGGADITELNAFTASADTRLDNLELTSASHLARLNQLSIESGSAQGRLTEIETITASLDGRLDEVESTTSSIEGRLDQIESNTGSYADKYTDSDNTDHLNSLGVVSGSEQITDLGFISESFSTDGTGILSGSTQVGALGFISSSQVSESIQYNGNRIISQERLPDFFSASFNPGTSGSVVDFLNAIFYPNSAPSITTGDITIEEWSGSGETIQTLVGTDPEGQTLTWGTGSSYTDDLVRVSSNGVLSLNATATSASFNTDLVGGVHGHAVVVTATDTFNSVTEKTIHIIVTPNAAPVFRETSVAGNIVTSLNLSAREDSTNGTLIKRVYFTDAEGDSITIHSSSISPAEGSDHFTITKSATYVDITQNTGSLDYEDITSYTFSISASDSHYDSGDDADSITALPVTINVTDNVQPTINNQTLGSINENSNAGTTVGTISAADTEGDTITFSGFELHKLELDNVVVTSGSNGGSGQDDPHEEPFSMTSAGVVTRKSGVYLNSDVINEYQYRVVVKDSFNTASNEAIITINIDDDTPATLTDNWSAGPYIIESAVDGNNIRTANTFNGGSVATYSSNQSGTWSSSKSGSIEIDSSGRLTVNVDLSGSATQSGDTIDSVITFTNTFGTTTTDNLTVTLFANQAPTATFTNQSSNLNENLATTNTNLVSVAVSDTESDSPYSASLSGTDASKLNINYTNATSSSLFIRANEDLSAGTYNYDFKVSDSYGKSTTYSGRSVVIASADIGTLGGDTTSYIIESAESGALLRENTNGRTGTQAQLTVSYSPNYGSQAVASFTSSLEDIIVVDNSGNLSLAFDLSGSATQSSDTITPTITFVDQYGNIGSGSITVNLAANQAPTATFTNQSANFETDLALTNVTMVSMSVSDTEGDTPFSASLAGTDASSLKLVYTNANSSSIGIQAASNLTAKTYNYDVVVSDSYGKSTTYSGRTFTIAQSSDYGKTYIYRSDYGTDAGLSSNYLALMGASTVDSSTPPEVTAYTANASSPFRLISSSLGDSSLSLAGGGTATLVDTISGSTLDGILSASNPFTMGNTAEQYLIIVPSGSDMIGVPTSMRDSFGGSTAGEYVMAVSADGGNWGAEASVVHLLDTSGSVNGYDKHFVIGRTGQNAAASVEIRMIASSGSLPS